MQIYGKIQAQITCFSQVFKSVTRLELQLQLADMSHKSHLNSLVSSLLALWHLFGWSEHSRFSGFLPPHGGSWALSSVFSRHTQLDLRSHLCSDLGFGKNMDVYWATLADKCLPYLEWGQDSLVGWRENRRLPLAQGDGHVCVRIRTTREMTDNMGLKRQFVNWVLSFLSWDFFFLKKA